jgi:photosystem II stability/assembly factor-like uncharacterized protein
MRLGFSALVGWGVCCAGLLLACDQVTTSSQTAPDASPPTGWTAIPAGTANLNSVSGVSDNAVWAVGDKGTIWFWNGTSLAPESSGTQANLRGVWALSPNSAYAVGDGGTILERSAVGWKQVGANLTHQVLTAVWADTPRVVAVGSNGTVVLGQAAGYQLLPNNSFQENLFGVTGTPGGPISAVGALGLLIQINGTTITRTKIANFIELLTGATTGTTNSYFVGQQGNVFVADTTGQNPTPVVGCPAAALRSVATAGAAAWIVGWDGTICKVVGNTATSYQYTDNRWFNGVYAASATSLWVVGASGTLFHGLPLLPAAGDL